MEELTEKIITRFKDNLEVLDFFDKLDNLFCFSECEALDMYFCEGFRLGMFLSFDLLGIKLPKELLGTVIPLD